MKMKVAVFKNTRFGYEVVSSLSYENDDDYVQISESIEVDFPPLTGEEVIKNQIVALDKMAEKVREKASDQLAAIEQRKAELLALPAPDNTGCGDDHLERVEAGE